MQFDGVRLSARKRGDDCAELIPLIEAISDLYRIPARRIVSSIYVHDKARAMYGVDLADAITPSRARLVAVDICRLFRRMGGYNNLIVRSRGEVVLDEDPWWPVSTQ
jgi:hypothetical protein